MNFTIVSTNRGIEYFLDEKKLDGVKNFKIAGKTLSLELEINKYGLTALSGYNHHEIRENFEREFEERVNKVNAGSGCECHVCAAAQAEEETRREEWHKQEETTDGGR